jgi:hypothetical protein
MHNSQYNKEEKNLQIEKVSVKKNKVIQKKSSEVDVLCIRPYGLLKLNFYLGDSLAHLISKQE